MHYTFYLLEPQATRGMEFCCDWCNVRHHPTLKEAWYYQRYSKTDVFPSNFVCYDCRRAMELNP